MCASARWRSARCARTCSTSRDEFARDFILPALQAGAIYEGALSAATALGRPLIAKHLVEIARIEGATAIAHGCARARATITRGIERAVRALDPSIRSSRRRAIWEMTRAERSTTRGSAASRCRDRSTSPYTIDANLWGRSIECAACSTIRGRSRPRTIYTLTRRRPTRRTAGVRRDRVRARACRSRSTASRCRSSS